MKDTETKNTVWKSFPCFFQTFPFTEFVFNDVVVGETDNDEGNNMKNPVGLCFYRGCRYFRLKATSRCLQEHVWIKRGRGYVGQSRNPEKEEWMYSVEYRPFAWSDGIWTQTWSPSFSSRTALPDAWSM